MFGDNFSADTNPQSPVSVGMVAGANFESGLLAFGDVEVAGKSAGDLLVDGVGLEGELIAEAFEAAMASSTAKTKKDKRF